MTLTFNFDHDLVLELDLYCDPDLDFYLDCDLDNALDSDPDFDLDHALDLHLGPDFGLCIKSDLIWANLILGRLVN